MPVHFSTSSNHKEPSQLLQDKLFQLRISINRTSLLRHNESQAVFPHQGHLTLPGTINMYDMGWRLASRAMCPATLSDSVTSSKLSHGLVLQDSLGGMRPKKYVL
ncbi:hypothetical protein TNCV_1291691 [Trichonephila clavipes]|nr:hypothetical protein TNCV_1291691 [Trichonephila clavipes]